MSQTLRPAELYRKIVRDICVNFHSQNRDDEQVNEFHEYLLTNYQQAKRTGISTEVFVFAAGLLTYGHIEVVDDILNNIPPGKGHVRRLAWTVSTLLPAPEGMDPLKDVLAVKSWLSENKEKLRWNKQEMRFLIQ